MLELVSFQLAIQTRFWPTGKWSGRFWAKRIKVCDIRLKRIEKGEQGWQGTAWAMERQNPERFGSPEVQLRRKTTDEPTMSPWEIVQYVERAGQDIERLISDHYVNSLRPTPALQGNTGGGGCTTNTGTQQARPTPYTLTDANTQIPKSPDNPWSTFKEKNGVIHTTQATAEVKKPYGRGTR
jgi:hypothetical protein